MWVSQLGQESPFLCRAAAASRPRAMPRPTGATVLWNRWDLSAAPACAPACAECEELWSLSSCAFVPSTAPRTSFDFAQQGCVACAAGLRDHSGCGCAGCWSTLPPSPPMTARNTTGLAATCARRMCELALEVPCVDCAEMAPSEGQCEACVRRQVAQPAMAGLCDFTLRTGGICNPQGTCQQQHA